MTAPQANEIASLINRLDRLMRYADAREGLNPAQWETLRYLASANRFSQTPSALAAYLNSTRGTISQTLMTLEKNDYVERQVNERDARSLLVSITKKGTKALNGDPQMALADAIESASGDRLGDVLHCLRGTLSKLISANGGRAFGVCQSCQHFRANANANTKQPHHCSLLNEALSDVDSEKICAEHQA
jgi:DNA-binding MarR family transcriptional regulator